MAKNYMTVEDLIKQLQEVDPKRVVVSSQDPEGNGFSYLHEISTGSFNAERGDTGIEELTPELEEAGWSEEDVGSGRGWKKAVILWPS